MGGGKTVTYKGHTVIHDDRETKLWMYKLLAGRGCRQNFKKAKFNIQNETQFEGLEYRQRANTAIH